VKCQGGGSVGGTPHSGRPLGRWMRFGSQSSPAAALNRCKDCIRIPMKQEERKPKKRNEIFLSNIKFLPILIQIQLLLFCHLEYNKKTFHFKKDGMASKSHMLHFLVM
jgi:hypothetical protein